MIESLEGRKMFAVARGVPVDMRWGIDGYERDEQNQPSLDGSEIIPIRGDALKRSYVAMAYSDATVVARLMPDGTLDPTFNPTGKRPGMSYWDKKYSFDGYIADSQTNLFFFLTKDADGKDISRIVKTNADGSLDATFAPGTQIASQLIRRSNGEWLTIGGSKDFELNQNYTTIETVSPDLSQTLHTDWSGNVAIDYDYGQDPMELYAWAYPLDDGRTIYKAQYVNLGTHTDPTYVGLIAPEPTGDTYPPFSISGGDYIDLDVMVVGGTGAAVVSTYSGDLTGLSLLKPGASQFTDYNISSNDYDGLHFGVVHDQLAAYGSFSLPDDPATPEDDPVKIFQYRALTWDLQPTGPVRREYTSDVFHPADWTKLSPVKRLAMLTQPGQTFGVPTVATAYVDSKKILWIRGTDGKDQVNMSQFSDKLSVSINGQAHIFSAGRVNRVVVDLAEGDDSLLVSRIRPVNRPMYVFAGGGSDSVRSGTGDDSVNAGEGDDLITSLGGKDTLMGKGGNDVIYGSLSIAHIRPGLGNDTVHSGGRLDVVVDRYEYISDHFPPYDESYYLPLTYGKDLID